MKTITTLALASAVAITSHAAMAATSPGISITVLTDFSDYASATVGALALEDFEGLGDAGDAGPTPANGTEGRVWTPSTVTSVGTFTPIGGTGNGSVCNAQSGPDCADLFLARDPANSGQGNTVPFDVVQNDPNAEWALSSNDTEGMIWTASLAGGVGFNWLGFVVQDVADQSGTIFTVLTPDYSETVTSGGNGKKRFVQIHLPSLVSSLEVRIFNANGRTDDGFTFDGGAIAVRGDGGVTDTPPVPLPAPALLLLGGLAGLGALRGLKRKAA
jgi:hypothetical protein